MAIQIQGNGGVTAEVSGSTFRAVRTENKPIEYGSLGAYSYGGFTGILPAALAANSEIFQFRWADRWLALAVLRYPRLHFSSAGLPATGTWTAAINVDWAEVTDY